MATWSRARKAAAWCDFRSQSSRGSAARTGSGKQARWSWSSLAKPVAMQADGTRRPRRWGGERHRGPRGGCAGPSGGRRTCPGENRSDGSFLEEPEEVGEVAAGGGEVAPRQRRVEVGPLLNEGVELFRAGGGDEVGEERADLGDQRQIGHHRQLGRGRVGGGVGVDEEEAAGVAGRSGGGGRVGGAPGAGGVRGSW